MKKATWLPPNRPLGVQQGHPEGGTGLQGAAKPSPQAVAQTRVLSESFGNLSIRNSGRAASRSGQSITASPPSVEQMMKQLAGSAVSGDWIDVKKQIEKLDVTDRANFLRFVESLLATTSCGGASPHPISALLKLKPTDRDAFRMDIEAICSLQKGRLPFSALSPLAHCHGAKRYDAALSGLQLSWDEDELNLLLWALGSQESSARIYLAASLKVLFPRAPESSVGIGKVANILVWEEDPGCIARRIRADFPFFIGHPKLCSLVGLLCRLDDQHCELLRRSCPSMSNDLPRMAGVFDALWNSDNSRVILIDTLQFLPPNQLSRAFLLDLDRAYHKFVEVLGEPMEPRLAADVTTSLCRLSFTSITAEQRGELLQILAAAARRGVNVTDVAAHAAALQSAISKPDLLPVLLRWLIKLTAGQRSALPRASDVGKVALDPGIPSWVQLVRGNAPPGKDVRVNWRHGCLDAMLPGPTISPPWDSMPLALLLPFKSEIRARIEAEHPGAMRALSDKAFNPAEVVHCKVSYLRLLEAPHAPKFLSQNPDFSYKDSLSVLRIGRTSANIAIAERAAIDRIESLFLAYETHVLRDRVLRPAREKAKALGVPLLLVGNLTYGGTALTSLPLREYKERYGVDMIFTKQGSTEAASGKEPHILNPNLFSQEELAYIFKRRPLMVVADGSMGDHLPQAFRGYRNLVARINTAQGLNPYALWARRGLDDTPFESMRKHEPLDGYIEKLAQENPQENAIFDLHYATLSGNPMKTQFFNESPPDFSWDKVTGPGVICVDTTLAHEDIERRAQSGDLRARRVLSVAAGRRHVKAAFDDNARAQKVDIYRGESGLKLKPRVHRPARDAFIALS